MTKCRRMILLALLPLTMVATAGVLTMLPVQTGVKKADFDTIKSGTTKNQVEEILGETGVAFPWAGSGSFAWHADSGELLVLVFDSSGRMEQSFCWHQETFYEKIRRVLRFD